MPQPPNPQDAGESSATYPNPGGPATPSLADQLREKIAREGPIPFPDFMAVALYDREQGYYAKTVRQVGRGGDFFTSVSVGPVFGQLLARRFAREWHDLGQPEKWRILECGAHDGTLAKDILTSLATLDPAAYDAVEYDIPGFLPLPEAEQKRLLAPFGDKVQLGDALKDLYKRPLPGIAFGNEFLDALKFHVVECRNREWHVCRVALDDAGHFSWDNSQPIDERWEIARVLKDIGTDFPDGYRTEVRDGFPDILRIPKKALTRGTMVWIDYGFTRSDYYQPNRTRGTLRTFANHRAGEDPLISPGDLDITAHVDFTQLAESAEAMGCEVRCLRDQGSWLTEIAREWLLEMEGNPDPSALRQFQTLTHPGHLGRSFQVMEISMGSGDTPVASLHSACGSAPTA